MYLLRVYAASAAEDEEHDAERAAIDSARRHLKDLERPAFAEIRDKRTSSIVWTGYLAADGSIIERAEREPGSD